MPSQMDALRYYMSTNPENSGGGPSVTEILDDNQSTWDFLKSSLATGTGAFMETGAHILKDYMTPEAWDSSYDLQWLENTGKKLQEDNQRYYEPGSGKYYASALLQSAPEMVFDFGAGALGAAAAGSVLGPIGAGASAMGRTAMNATKWGQRAYDFYKNGGNAFAKGARFLTPSGRTITATIAQTPLEARFEGQRATDDYIKEAKANGTYIEGQTEQEARDLGSRVFRDNMIALTGTNGIENALTFGKGKGGFMRALGRLGVASGMEGLEEGIQQIIPKAEQGKDWSVTDRDVLESAALGAIMGGGLHLTGRGMKHLMPGLFGDNAGTPVPSLPSDGTATTGLNVTDYGTPSNPAEAAMLEEYTQAATDPLKNGAAAQQIDATNQAILAGLADSARQQQVPQVDTNIPESKPQKESQPQQESKSGTVPIYDDIAYETSGVSSTAVTDDTAARLNALAHSYQNKFGEKLLVTSMKRDGDGSSWHDSGKAFDVAGGGLETNERGEREWIMQEGERLGLTPLDEYAHPSAHATGGHIHFSNHDDENKPAIGGQAPQQNVSGGKAAFFNAIAQQESGGNYNDTNSDTGAFGKYQIMPENWPSWAEEAGLSRDAEQTPENQEIVAKYKLGQYYDKYGAAGAMVAWYSGEGNAERYVNGESTDIWGNPWTKAQSNGPAIQTYVDQVAERMGNTPVETQQENNYNNGTDISGKPGAHVAQLVSQKTGLPADWIWAQMAFESGDFNSALAREDHNYGGIKRTSDSQPSAGAATDGGTFRHFDSDEEYADYYAKTLNAYAEDGIKDAKNLREFVEALGRGGYFGNGSVDDYYAGLKAKIGEGSTGGAHQVSNVAEMPDFIKQGQDGSEEFYNQFAQHVLSTSSDINAINNVRNLLNSKDQLINNEANRQALANAFPAEMMDFYDRLYAPKHPELQTVNTTTEQPVVPKQEAKQAEEPSIDVKAPNLESLMDSVNTQNEGNILLQKMRDNNIPHNTKAIESALRSDDLAKVKSAVRYMASELGRYGIDAKDIVGYPTTMRANPSVQRREKMQAKPVKENVMPQEQPAQPLMLAMAPVAETVPQRVQQAQAIEQVAQQNNVNIPRPVKLRMMEGARPAIRTAQGILRSANVETPSMPTVEPKGVVANETQSINTTPPTSTQSINTENQIQHTEPEQAAEQKTEVSHFDTSDYTHTKTGKKIPAAKIAEKVDKDTYSKIRDIAKKHGGKYNRFAKRFFFKDAEGREAFTQEAEREVFKQESKAPIDGKASQSSQEHAEDAKTPAHEVTPAKENKQPENEHKEPSKIAGRNGKEATVTTDSGKTVNVRYRIVPSNKVITSHSPVHLNTNKEYPAELQPRDRQRVAMREQITKMAKTLRPEDLTASRNLNQGAPVMRNDGVILNGNGRAIAIASAQIGNNNAAKAYKKYLVDHAEEFGFNSEEVAKLKNPILVREVIDDIDKNTTQDIINSTTGGSRMGASEQAKADAKKIKTADLDRYAENEKGDLTTPANRDFVAGILYNITNENERNAYTDDNGNVNADGIQRVKRALFSAAYGDDELISKMAESTDDNIRNVSNALMNAAPSMAKVNLMMDDGTAHKYDLAKTIAEATKRFDSLRQEGKPVEGYLNEQSMFSEYEDTPETKDVLKFFDDNKRSAKKIGQFLRRVADLVESQGDPRQTSLIATEPMSLRAIIDTAKEDVTHEGAGQDLFAAPQEMGAVRTDGRGESNTEKASTKRKTETNVKTATPMGEGSRTGVNLENANAASMQDTSVESHDAVQNYKDKAEAIVKDFYDGKINKTQAREQLKQLVFDANKERHEHVITDEEALAAQGFATAGIGKLKDSTPSKAKKNKEQKPKADETIFGNVDDNYAEMFDALGIDPNALTEETLTAPEGIENTAAERERLEKELAAELNKISANPVFNPKIYSLGLKLGMTYVKDGINTVKKLVAKLNATFGDKIGPWAPAIVETISTWPKGVPFNEKQVMAISKTVGSLYENGITSLDDVQADMQKRLKGQHKAFAPMIEASYNGIKKFFETKEGLNHAEQRNEGKSESTTAGRSNVESGEVSRVDIERGRSSAGRNGETGGRKSKAQPRNEANATETDGPSEKSGGRSAEGVGSKNDSTGNGTGRDKSPVLNGDKPAEIPGNNYHITRTTNQGAGGEKTKYKQSVSAIKLLKQLESENRNATPSEQDTLAKYNGWGSVKSAFSDDPKWAKENKELRELLTKDEYDAAARASLNAFYTSPDIIKAMWNGVKKLGFTNGRILDPSMGNGNFFGMMPVDMMEKSNLYGVELDPITARIAKQLYQKADIKQGGFEATRLPNDFFDLAISNIPFGSIKLADPAYEKSSSGEKAGYLIHNYFFAKAMDKVRPGGLVAFITGPGTMQSKAGEAKTLRLEMGRKADLVAAYKLPGEAFQHEAGTTVTTDVLILQKRIDPKKPAPYAQKWEDVVDYRLPGERGYDIVSLNEYYKNHPENMLGTPKADKLYGGNGERFALGAKGQSAADIGKALTKAMNKLPKDIVEPVRGKQHDTVKATQTFLANAGSYDHAYTVKDGKAYQNINGVNTPVPAKDQKVVTDFVKLRAALNSVLRAQIDAKASDKTLAILRKDLNKEYDSFVKKHGYLNKPTNINRLGDDPMYGQTAAIEKYSENGGKVTASKTDIFTKRTVGAIQEVTSAESPSDALTVSIAQHGRVDLPYMSKLLNRPEDEIINSLEGALYHNPITDSYELAEEYLSGNVRAKLEQAKEAAKTDPAFKKNVDALEKVQPVDMTENDVTPHLGAPWISPETITDFINHMIGVPLKVTRDGITGTWSISQDKIWEADRTALNNKWGFDSRHDFRTLLEALLGMKEVTIYTTDIDNKRIVDTARTAAVAQKMDDIQNEFAKWVWSDDTRKASLLKTYNKMFNSEVERQYDGSALTFPGLVSHIRNKLYEHQKNAIWRIMQGGNTLLAHCVGAGKTWTMQISGMEMKRVGICRKPMYVVPNNVVEQFRKEFYETYPNAKLLVLTSKDLPQAKTNIEFDEKLDTKKHNQPKKEKAAKKSKETTAQKRDRLTRRRAALSRIATEDWDGIIISHNLFANLPMSPEYYQKFYKEMVSELDAAIREAKGNKMSKRNITDLENAKANLEEKLKRDISEDKKEVVIPFEELGVDQLFVDEADKFKNLAFYTSMTRLSGISSSGSKRAMDMYVKTRFLGETQNGRGVVFATGTPISNTMNEMFTMQRYLVPNKLNDLGMKYFDTWASMFGSKKSEAEPKPNGDGFQLVDKLKFTNLKTLGAMFRTFADIKTPEDLPYLKRPKLKGGKRSVVSVKPSEAFNRFKKTLIERVNDIRSGDVKPSEDNMLKLTSDFRNASMDMRLVDPTVPAEEASAKINALADVVADRYVNSLDPKGAQLIFSDIGTPKTKKETESDTETEDNTVNAESITVYDEIKKALIKRGVPADEIGFVHDAKNPKQRQKLFDKVRAGELRVFIGSTEMMGAGTNFQDHLVALHHFDCPWKPRDIEQREGRILRAGNQNPEVEIFSYVTEGSFDANMWDKVRYKQQMIDSVMQGDPSVDEMDDINSNTSASFGDIEAIAMDNPLMADKVKIDAKVTRLQSLASTYNIQRRTMTHELSQLPGKIHALKDDIARIQKDVKETVSTRGDAFKMTIGKNTFTKRADAKKAWEALNKAFTSTASVKVGEIGGMEIHMLHDESCVITTADGAVHVGDNRVQLVKNSSYLVPMSSLESIEHTVNESIAKKLATCESDLKDMEKRVDGLTAQLKEPFAQQQELNDALAEQRRINEALENNNKKKQTQPVEDTKSDTHYSADEKQQQIDRTMNDFVDEIKQSIPNAKEVKQDGTKVAVTMPNGSTIEFDIKNIKLDKETEARVRRENNIPARIPIRVNGREYTIDGHKVVELSKAADIGTTAHELTHIAMELYLTDKERAALYKGYQKIADRTGRDVEEVIADAAKDLYLHDKKYGNYNKLHRKLHQAWDSLVDMFHGVYRANKVLRSINSGKVWERQTGITEEKIKYSGEEKSLDNSDNLGDNIDTINFAPDLQARLNNGKLMNRIHDNMDDTEVREILELPVKRKCIELANMYEELKREGAPEIRVNAIRNILKAALRTLDMERRAFYEPGNYRSVQRALQENGKIRDRSRLEEAFSDRGNRIDTGRIGNSNERTRTIKQIPGEFANFSNNKTILEIQAEIRNDRKSDFSVEADRTAAYKKLTDMVQKAADSAGFSDAHYSVSPQQQEAPKGFLNRAFSKLGKSAGIKADKIIVEESAKPSQDSINLKQYLFQSPSRIAGKVAAFREFYIMGDRAMNVLTKNRSDYARKLNQAFDLVKNKEDRQELNNILLSGDAEGKEWTKQELVADGVKENVADAYIQIRRLMTKAYKMVNEARRRPTVKTINKASEKQMNDLRNNKFVEILNTTTDSDGHKKVTYKEYANWERTYTVDKETMDKFKADPAMQILDVHKDGDEFTTTVREAVQPVNKLTGYIPHFFHEYMIRVKDSEGNYVATIGSGRTETEAIKKADEWLKNNELANGQKIYISPKTFDFTSVGMDEGQYAPVMGDTDYYKMMQNVAKNNDMTLEQAKELMDGSVRKKNRHRFFGNVMHRKGVEGFETDMGYILNHYFNSASRYYAMETEFKPKAINLYERLFGDFNQDAPNRTANYVKDYINDINGNPTWLEDAFNDALNKSSFYRKYVTANFGDRAVLRLANTITSATTYMCLGYLNASSALLNFTQIMNSAAYIGDVSALAKCIAKGAHRKYSLHDLKILKETNVLNDIGLDSGSGYDVNRMSAKSMLGKINKGGMVLFKESEGMVRRGTVLAAYEKARKDGKTHDEAIQFAKDVNRKSNFDYGVADAPNIFRRGSIVSQIALQFKKYGIKELEVMADMFPTNNKTSRKQKMIFWGTYFLAAGLMGLPMLDFFDKWPFDEKLKLKVEDCMMEAAGNSELGKVLAKTALFGLASSTIGIDISSRAGLSDVIPTRGSDLLGASISKPINFMSDMFKGDHASALRDVSPGLYNQYAAWIAGQSVGKRGRVNNTYDSFYDKLLRSIGFKSTEERVDSDISRIVTMRKKEGTTEKQQAIDAYIEDPSSENFKRLKELGIKPKQVKDERKKKKQDRLGRTSGNMSKQNRKDNDKLMRFAE